MTQRHLTNYLLYAIFAALSTFGTTGIAVAMKAGLLSTAGGWTLLILSGIGVIVVTIGLFMLFLRGED